jgi:hypothetical protein
MGFDLCVGIYDKKTDEFKEIPEFNAGRPSDNREFAHLICSHECVWIYYADEESFYRPKSDKEIDLIISEVQSEKTKVNSVNIDYLLSILEAMKRDTTIYLFNSY